MAAGRMIWGVVWDVDGGKYGKLEAFFLRCVEFCRTLRTTRLLRTMRTTRLLRATETRSNWLQWNKN